MLQIANTPTRDNHDETGRAPAGTAGTVEDKTGPAKGGHFCFTGSLSGNRARIAATAFVVLILALPSAGADDNEIDGNLMLDSCQEAIEKKPEVFTGWCLGYLKGFSDGERLAATYADTDKRITCIPDGVSVGQTVRVLVAFLEKHPQILHLTAGMLVMLALHDAFPCPSGEGQ